MLVGSADPEAHARGAPSLAGFDAEAVSLGAGELVQVLFEIASARVCELLPPALHPTLPGVVGWLVYRLPDTPWGPLRMVQTRIECRSGTRPRAFLVGGVIDNEAAGEALAARFGYRLLPGEVDYRRSYDAVRLRVRRGGANVLELELREPTLLPPDAVQFVSGLHPAHTPRGYRLLQVDVAHDVSRAERCRPRLAHFDAQAWGEAGIEPRHPISASACLAQVRVAPLRFLCRPGELAFTGAESLT